MPTLTLNGVETDLDADGAMPLLWAIRDIPIACHQTRLRGRRRRFPPLPPTRRGPSAALLSVSARGGATVPTNERVAPEGGRLFNSAWRDLSVPQCGFCHQIMQAAALLIENPKPNHDQIREAMAGNICRCGCYQRIENAVHLASTGV